MRIRSIKVARAESVEGDDAPEVVEAPFDETPLFDETEAVTGIAFYDQDFLAEWESLLADA